MPRSAMALRKSEVHIGFRGGVDTKTDPLAVPPTQLLTLENGVFGRSLSIRKRNGYEALGQSIDGSASTLTDAIRLKRRGGELLAFSRTKCFSHQADADQWSDAGSVFSAVGADRPLVKTGTQQTMPDQAELDGVRVVAWEDSLGGVYWTAVDAVGGRVHRAPTQADAVGQSPRCVPVGGNLHIYYAVPTQRRIMVIVVSPETPSAAVTPVILVEDIDSTNTVYDACSTTRTGSPALIAWHEHATTNYRIGYVDASGVLGSPATGHPSVATIAAGMSATTPLGVAYRFFDGADSDALGVAYVNAALVGKLDECGAGSGSVSIAVNNTTTMYAASTSVQRIAVAIAVLGSAASHVFWTAFEEAAAASSNRFCVVNSLDPAVGTPTGETTLRSVGLASRAFAIDVDAFATFVHDTTYFNTYLTLRLSDFICVGRQAPAAAAGAPTRKHLSSWHVVDDTATGCLPVRTRLISENGDKFTETGIRLFTLDFDTEDSHQVAQLGAGLYMAGACPQHYDGRAWTEQGFHVGPELIATVNGTSGSLTQSTTYLYRAWYESTDAQGEIHRGPVSSGTLVTMGASDDEVTLTLPTLRVTAKSNVRICVARSLAAKTGRTAQLFRVTSYDPSTAGTANGYVANTTAADTVSFNDRMSDAVLETQEELYTDGGILSNDPCPLGSAIAVVKGRLFTTDPSDGNTVRFSQQIDDGYGVEFAPELQIKTDPKGGDVTALAEMDDRLVIFKASSVFICGGDGPLANGLTDTQGFSTPQLVPGDVGCSDPASIVLTPVGLMFNTGGKGIWQVDRGGSVSYVGALVEAYNAQRFTSAIALPNRTQIVFLTDSGKTLLYDYFFQQWSTFTNHEGYDGTVVSGTYHYLRTDGRVFRETIGSYSDAGTRITLRLETAWIHLAAALQGFQRFWNLLVLGTWISPHQLAVQFRTNYAPSWTDPLYVDATGESSSTGWITGGGADTIGVDPITGSVYGEGDYGSGDYGGTAPDVYQWRFHIGGRGQSVQFRFEDFERDGLTGGAFELSEMLIEGGVAGTSYKPFSAARSG